MTPDVQEPYFSFGCALKAWLLNFKISHFLCSATCVYIESGKAKISKGRHFDCKQDIEAAVKAGPSEIIEKDLLR